MPCYKPKDTSPIRMVAVTAAPPKDKDKHWRELIVTHMSKMLRVYIEILLSLYGHGAVQFLQLARLLHKQELLPSGGPLVFSVL